MKKVHKTNIDQNREIINIFKICFKINLPLIRVRKIKMQKMKSEMFKDSILPIGQNSFNHVEVVSSGTVEETGVPIVNQKF